MLAREGDHQLRKEIVAGTDHRHVQLAASDSLQLRHRIFRLVELLDDGAAEVQQLVARLGEINLLSQLFEQGHADVALERADLGRHGRLGEVQLLGGARKAEAARDRLEDLQLTQCRVLHRFPHPGISSR